MSSAGNVVATAYVQLIPTLQGAETAVTSEMNALLTGAGTAAGANAGKKAGRRMAEELSRQMTITGAVTSALTAPVRQFGKDSITSAAEFNNSMSYIQGITGATAGEMEAMRGEAMRLAGDTIFTTQEVADAMVELGKGGFDVATMRAGALQATLDLAAAGGESLGDSAVAVVRAMGAFGISAADSTRVASALAGAANASSADMAGLMWSLQQSGAAAHNAGWSLEETAAAISLFADKGIAGSDAGTSLKTMLRRLSAPTDTARGLMEQYGISIYNADGSMKTMQETAQMLHDAFSGLSNEERNAALSVIFGSDAMRSAIILNEAGAAGVQKYVDATLNVSAAEEMAASRFDETGRAMLQMEAAVQAAKVALGTALAPIVTVVANGVRDLATWFSGLPQPVQLAIAAVGGVVAVIGPLALVIGNVIQVGLLLGPALKAAGTAVMALGRGFMSLSSPVGLVITAIGLVVTALVSLYQNNEDFRAFVDGAVQGIMDFAASVGEFLGPKIEAIGEFVSGLVTTVGEGISKVGEFFAGVGEGIAGFAAGVGEKVTEVGGFFAGAAASAGEFLAGAGETAATWLEGVGTTVGDFVTQTGEGLASGWESFKQGAGDFFTTIGEGTATAFEGIKTTISQDMQAGSDIASALGTALSSGLSGDFDTARAAADAAFGAIQGFIGSKMEAAKQGAIAAGNAIGEKLGFPGLGDKVAGVFGGAKEKIDAAMSGAKSIVSGAIDMIGGFFAGARLQLPHISLPHFSISGSFSLNPPSIPHIGIEWYKTGGIALGPSIVGIGEAGPEAVVPLGGPYMRPFVDGVAEAVAGMQSVTVNVEIGSMTVRSHDDASYFARVVGQQVSRRLANELG